MDEPFFGLRMEPRSWRSNQLGRAEHELAGAEERKQWVDGEVRCIVLWADTAVAEGLFVRRWEEEDGAYRYRTKESAPEPRTSTGKKLLQ
jgi:hypothetical protein